MNHVLRYKHDVRPPYFPNSWWQLHGIRVACWGYMLPVSVSLSAMNFNPYLSSSQYNNIALSIFFFFTVSVYVPSLSSLNAYIPPHVSVRQTSPFFLFEKTEYESAWPKFPDLHTKYESKVLFRCKKILDFATVAFSFVCGKYCPIMD